MIQAIETEYNGYRFRSRLEARWAVFFDALGVRYEYEKEGYILDGVRYLPDFWLPSVGPKGTWVEIKGQEPTANELKKTGLLCLNTKAPVLLYLQDPYWPVPSCLWMYFTKVDVFHLAGSNGGCLEVAQIHRFAGDGTAGDHPRSRGRWGFYNDGY
jgi:hypothetical protein